MSRFLQALQSGRVLLMDGGMGSELRRAGLPDGEKCEAWNLSHPERVRAVHTAYVEAGAEVLLTNTFQAHRFGCAVGQAILLARSAAGDRAMTMLSIGPPPQDGSMFDWPTLLAGAGVPDGVVMETWSDPDDARDALKQLREVRELRGVPFLISAWYRKASDGTFRSTGDHTPREWARRVSRWKQVVALGVNCGVEMTVKDCAEVVRQYRSATNLPLFARPNAGTPRKEGGQRVYPQTPQEMAAGLPELISAGVRMVGGCCGTTPEHIAAFRVAIRPTE
jgi:methionine synthase I (cobalamin-dependent)